MNQSPARPAIRPVGCIFLVSVLLAGCGNRAVELELITPQQPVDRAIAEDLAAYVGEGSGLRIKLVPPPPEDEAILDALESGYGDLAFASNDQPFRQAIASIMPLYPTVLHMIIRSGRSSGDYRQTFAGARILAGPSGSASRLLVERLLTALDVSADEITYVVSPEDSPDVVVLYSPIQPDFAPPLPGYEFVSLGVPQDIGLGSLIDRATLLHPQVRPFIIPVGTYGELNPAPVVTIAVDKLLVARTDLEDTVAYDLIREILRLRPVLSGKRPTIFHGLEDEFDASGFTFALHPGARDYLERDAPGWLERYSGIAEVLVTMFVAIVSGLVAAVNIFRIRRKNRIDEFYGRVFDLRDSIDRSASTERKGEIIEELRALQEEAYRMLIEEKLAANESFRIFITLSNDAIRELGGRASCD